MVEEPLIKSHALTLISSNFLIVKQVTETAKGSTYSQVWDSHVLMYV